MNESEQQPRALAAGAPAFRVPSSLGLVNKESGAPVNPRRTRKLADEIRIPTGATPRQVADRLLLCAAIMLDAAVLAVCIVVIVSR